jgi:hypothetical protein
MDRYQLIKGFRYRSDAEDYADRLPLDAFPKVVPYAVGRNRYAFAVDVSRDYTGGRV